MPFAVRSRVDPLEIQMWGGGIPEGGRGAGGIIKPSVFKPCKLPAILAPPLCKWRRLELKPILIDIEKVGREVEIIK